MFISFLGIGQGGGNIADEAAKRGFYAGAINFSTRDLESLTHVKLKQALIGSEGIGKLRQNAIELMTNNWDIATNFVKENFSHPSIEIIIVPFATGGGSGSGIAPVLLSLLQETMPDKVFVAMPILPDKKESYISQRNCLETFEDLSTLNMCILPVDNEKGRMKLNSYSKSNLFQTVNNSVVEYIEKLISFTNKSSKNGVIDKKDIRAIFSINGVATIGTTELSSLQIDIASQDRGISNKVKESWITSIFAEVETNKVISAGLVYEGQEKLMQYVNPEKIFSIFDNKMPISLYEGYYNSESTSITTILSGLPWINSRLKEIDIILESTNQKLSTVNNQEIYKSKTVNHMEMFINPTKKTEKVKDISSIINKFKR